MTSFRKMKLIPEAEYLRLIQSAEPKPVEDMSPKNMLEPTEDTTHIPNEEEIPASANNYISNKELILSFMPKRIKLRVAKLLDFIDTHSDIINVNHSSYPLIKINNSLIENSNCITLIKYLYSTSQKSQPIGYAQFIHALHTINPNLTFSSFHNSIHKPPGKLAKFRKLY